MDTNKLLKVMAEWDLILDAWILWDDDLEFYVLCNDVFFWGCADAESIRDDKDIDLLIECLEATNDPEFKGKASFHGCTLYAAKRRGIRPQGAVYDTINEKWHHLFDECGDVREAGAGNPYKQPSERGPDDPAYKPCKYVKQIK